MAADFVIKAGDTRPVLSDSLTYSNGSVVDLTGATVTFVMRSTTATTAAVNRAATVVNAAAGLVQFTFTAAETTTAGGYLGEWHVTFSGGSTLTFPTDGYIDLWIEDSLTTAPQGIVPLADVKDFLNITATDRSHDQKLSGFIRAVTPLIEHVVGPVVPASYDEWYDGGSPWVMPRHRPILTLIAVSEYRGPIEFPLSIVASPERGTIYSCMLDPDGSRIVRRTVGGGTLPFFPGVDTVHVQYQAGRASVPGNIRQATLELIRENYQQTQQGGRPALNGTGVADTPSGPPDAFMSDRVRQMLIPNRRAPSVG